MRQDKSNSKISSAPLDGLSATASTILSKRNNTNKSLSQNATPEMDAELFVVKSILLREGYLQRLHIIHKENGDSIHPSIPHLLDIIRMASIDVVENIVLWRKRKQKESIDQNMQSSNMAYVWNGFNYLLKIPSDLDFLENNIVLVKWLGFSTRRNPFLTYLSMATEQDDEGKCTEVAMYLKPMILHIVIGIANIMLFCHFECVKIL